MTHTPWGVAANLLANTARYAFGPSGQEYRGFFGEGAYRTLDAYERDADALCAAHPGWLTRHPLDPPTLDGRHLTLLRIRAPSLPADAPRVLITGLMHAREFITGEVAMAALEAALPGGTASGRRLAGRCEIDVLPVMNPDGVALNMSRLAHGRRFGPLVRANRRGVDLNRNFGFGYSNSFRTYKLRFSDEFSGDGPFSEAESQALRDLCLGRRYAAVVNLHSYSNVVLYPRFGSEDFDPLVRSLVERLVELQPHQHYTPIQGAHFFKHFPGARLLFQAVRGTEWVHGTFDDWLFSIGTPSILIEVSTPGYLPERLGEIALSQLRAFNPPPSARLREIENVLPLVFGFFHGVLDARSA